MQLFDSAGKVLGFCFVFAFLVTGVVQAQSAMFPDNDARNAILKDRQRIDDLRLDFEKLRGDAEGFRTEADAVRREAQALRSDVNGVKTNLNLMLRKVDTKIDDGFRPIYESVQRSVDELEILKNAQQDLLNQLEDARKEMRELRGKTEYLEALVRDIRRKVESN